MKIRLITETGDDPIMAMRYAWHRKTLGLLHDCAVAHSLIDAIDGVLGKTAATDVYDVAREILRDTFGIEDQPMTAFDPTPEGFERLAASPVFGRMVGPIGATFRDALRAAADLAREVAELRSAHANLVYSNAELGRARTRAESAESRLAAQDAELAALRRERDRLRRDCGEAYQVCGYVMLGDDGSPYTERDAERVLDNLSAAASGLPRPHDDLLPWPAGHEPAGEDQ